MGMVMVVVSLVAGFVGVLYGVGVSAKVSQRQEFMRARVRQHRALRVLVEFLARERQRIDAAPVAPTHDDYRYLGAQGTHLAYLASLEAIDVDVVDILTKAQAHLAELRTYTHTECLLDETIGVLERATREAALRAASGKPTTYLGSLLT